MAPKLTSFFARDAGQHEPKDYILDMIEQLAELAREIDEVEVAIHLDATAETRRITLTKREE